jgi:hypothetical protein
MAANAQAGASAASDARVDMPGRSCSAGAGVICGSGVAWFGRVGLSSVAIDRRTGEIFEATNGRRGDEILPDQVHPLLEERLRQLREAGPYPAVNKDGSITLNEHGNPTTRDYPHPDSPLQHAEVKAANELLWRRGPDVDASTFEQVSVDNYFPLGREGVRQAPCCVNCGQLLSGTPSNAGRFTGFPPGDHNFLPE